MSAGQEQTTRGFQEPSNTQFSVFLDNRVGKLLELIDIFDDNSLRVVALSVVDSTDHAVVRLITTNARLSRRLLQEHAIPYSESDVIVVNLSANQSLADLCRSLLAAELNIHYAYPLMIHMHGAATMAIHTDDQILAGQILRRKQFFLMGEGDLLDDADEEQTF